MFLELKKKIQFFLILSFFFITPAESDSFKYNNFNNHGTTGLINTPSARFLDESSFGVTVYDGTPDQRVTFTAFPFDWLEASFFYTNIQGRPYPGSGFTQDYKDKGFNFKIRIKEEGVLPAIALGINDIGGTGLYSSEYLVASYGLKNLDMHFGIGWGEMSGGASIKNPLTRIDERFENRSNDSPLGTGEPNFGTFFSGENISPFFGISYFINDDISLKIENDPTVTPGKIDYEDANERITFGVDYSINDNFVLGLSLERNNYFSLRFSYKNNPKQTRKFKYLETEKGKDDTKYEVFIKNLEENGIGVNRLVESGENIGLEITQFQHPNLDTVKEVISIAKNVAGIDKDIQTDMKIVDLNAFQEVDQDIFNNGKVLYERKKNRNFTSNNSFSFRPFLASREEFFKGALMLENNTEFVVRDNIIFSSNLKYTLADNFDDLTIPPNDVYPAQVRSDIKDYLRNFDNGIIVGRAQFDYYVTPKANNHFMVTAGILEEMFMGYGMEYLYFKPDVNYAFGFELFNVKKRDYQLRFGTLDYENVTGSVNYYHRNYGSVPFDLKLSYGEYLAGDEGLTIDLSRSFRNGTKFGIFATFTDVSSEQFGEGSFDKGIYFNIPIFSNLVSYSWRPLTKDPGAKLVRKNNLYDLMVRFKPIN